MGFLGIVYGSRMGVMKGDTRSVNYSCRIFLLGDRGLNTDPYYDPRFFL